MREETVDEAHLIHDEESEDETDEPRDKSKSPIETHKSVFGERELDGNRGSDEHHACNCADSKNQ